MDDTVKPGAFLFTKGLIPALSLACMSTLQASSPNDLFDLSIEELVNLEVTSVSRKAERLADTTSAVFVITQDDIQRHGLRTIPDALRLAPGLTVSQIDANKWAIGSRGRAGRFSNKLLVLMDGRLLYTPSFSGVFWDVQQTLIEEIDRIEVIRGPGAVVWGTNAVNGVINIITRSSAAAPGGSVSGGVDSEGSEFFAVRQAGDLGEVSTYRGFLNFQSAEGNPLVGGGEGNDGWNLLRGSFRTDTNTAYSELSVTLEAYTGSMGQTVTGFDPQPPYLDVFANDAEVDGAFASARWSRTHSDSAKTSAQLYIDYTARESVLYNEDRTTYSFDLQHQRSFGRHEIVTGGWMRFNRWDITGSDRLTLAGDRDYDRVISVFVQDEITLVEDELSVELGLKVENAELSPDDLEILPSARLLWKPVQDQSIWFAVTRAVRTPSLADIAANVFDIGITIPPGDPRNPFPVPLRQGTVGNPNFESEINVSVEVGARGRISDSLSYDLALYHMAFDGIRSFVPSGVICSPSGVSVTDDPLCFLAADSVIAQSVFTNDNDSDIRGGELTLDWMPAENWRVRTAASYARERLKAEPLAISPGSTYPVWQYTLRSEWSPTDSLGLAALVRYVDEIELSGVDDYWQANVNLRWSINDSWVMSLGVRNLLRDATEEYQSEFGDVFPTEIERSAFLNVRYSY